MVNQNEEMYQVEFGFHFSKEITSLLNVEGTNVSVDSFQTDSSRKV